MVVKARSVLRIAVVVVALAVFACAASTTAMTAAKPEAPRTWKLGSLTLTACELGRPGSGETAAAWCAPFDVPENPADPQGRHIELRLAVARSDAEVADKDMVVLLAGGPGQAATQTYSGVASSMRALLKHHHIVLLDQRGTGGSNALDCAALGSGDADTPAGQASEPLDLDRLRMQLQTCVKQLSSRADPRYYTTTIATQDLEAVRQALGAPQFDLIGVSYGTRMAQQYARRYPHAVRSMVLEGVVPNALVLGEDFAVNLDASLKAQFALCTATPACKKRFGDPWQTLLQLRDALRANPHQVSFRDPQSYQTVTRTLDGDTLASLVRMYAYWPQAAALLPLSIDAAAHGDVGPLLGQDKMLSGDLSGLTGNGMQYSVICSEDADLLKARPQDADTIMGDDLIKAFQAACQVWPHGTRPADFHAPLHSDIPTLLLSGQFDPVTPPRYGAEVLKGLGNARHLVLKGQGHVVFASGCVPKLVHDFIDAPDPKRLDARCLDRLGPTPAFVGFNGATP